MSWSCQICQLSLLFANFANSRGCVDSYGSIVSNIGAALVGGPGVVPGANLGREYALFEPGCRHVAKDIMVRRWQSYSVFSSDIPSRVRTGPRCSQPSSYDPFIVYDVETSRS